MTLSRFVPLVAVLLSLAPTLLGAGREVAPRPVGPTPYATQLPSTAFAGERFLTIWFEQRGGIGSAIMGAFSDREGRRVTAEAFPILLTAINHYLQVVGTGDSYTIFWRDRFGGTQLLELDLEGRAIRQATVQLPQNITLSIGWNGTYFLAAMKHPAGIAHTAEAVLFDRNGRIVHRGIPLHDLGFRFEIVPENAGFTVLATGWDGLTAHRIANDGTSTGAFIEHAQGSTTTDYRPLVATGVAQPDGDVLVVWSAGRLNEKSDLKATILGSGKVDVITGANLTPVALSERMTLAAAGDRTIETLQLNDDGTFRRTVPRASAEVIGHIGDAASHEDVILVPYTAVSPGSGIPRTNAIALSAARVAAHDVLSLAPSRQSHPIVAPAGGAFLAVWTEQYGDPSAVRTARIDALGEPSNVRTLQDHAFLATRDLPSSGTDVLVTMVSGTMLFARRVTLDGDPIDEPLIVIANEFYTNPIAPPRVAVTWAGDRWVVVWSNEGALLFASVSRSGVVSAPQELRFETPLEPEHSRSVGAPAIAYDAPRVLMAWSETQFPPCFFPICATGPTASYAALLDRDGRVLTPQPLELPFDDEPHTFAAATSGREFLVTADAKAVVLQTAGNSLRVAGETTLPHRATDVVWDGTSFVLGMRFRTDYRWYAGTVRLDRAGNEIEPLRVVKTLAPEYFEGVSLAHDAAAGTILAVQETDLTSGARVVVYRESELAPLTSEPKLPRRRSVR